MDTTLVQLWDSVEIIWDSMDTTLVPLGILGSISGHFFLALLLCSLLQPCSRSFNLYNWDPHRVLRELHSEFGVSAFFEVTSSSSTFSSMWPLCLQSPSATNISNFLATLLLVLDVCSISASTFKNSQPHNWIILYKFEPSSDWNNFFIFRCQLCLIQGPRAGVYLFLLLWNIIIIKHIIMLAKHHNIITKVDIYKSVYVHVCVLDRNIVRVAPSGLGLPDRTYYTRFPNDSAIQVSLRSSLH